MRIQGVNMWALVLSQKDSFNRNAESGEASKKPVMKYIELFIWPSWELQAGFFLIYSEFEVFANLSNVTVS